MGKINLKHSGIFLVWYMENDQIQTNTEVNTAFEGLEYHNSISDLIATFKGSDQDRLRGFFEEMRNHPGKSFYEEAYLLDNNYKLKISVSPEFEDKKRTLHITYSPKHHDEDLYEIYRQMAEYSRDSLSLHHPDGTFYYLTQSVTEILGYTPEELIGVNPYTELFHPEDLKRIQEESHQNALKGDHDNRVEYRILHKKGHYVWLESHTEPIYDSNNEVEKLVTSSRDITKKKELEIFLDETGKLAKVGGWQYFPETQELEWTPETYRIHEVPINAPLDVNEAIAFYHPDYQDLIKQGFKNLSENGEPYDIEAKIITTNKKEKWVRAKGTAEWRGNKPYKIYGTFQDISDQKVIQEKLNANKKRINSLIENALDIIFWLDPQGYFTFLNQMAFSISGYKEEELKGQHFSVLLSDQEYKKAVSWLEQLINKEITNFYEQIAITTKQGEKRWLGIQVQRVEFENDLEEIVGVARDITEHVKAEEQLLNTSSRLNTLIENLQSGILVEDENREVIFANYHFCEMFHIEELHSQLKRANSYKLLDQAQKLFKNPEEFANQVNALIQNKTLKLKEEWELKDGRILERDYIPIFQADNHLGHLWHYKDITERKRTEHELREAKEMAEQGSKAQEDFLSTMSHEIRTPLNAIIGISQILLEDDPKPEQVENLKALNFSGENLLNLINDILDFNKIKAGKIDLETEPFNLDELIRSLQKTHSFKAEEKGVKLKYMADGDIPQKVIGDKTRISQVLTNLISNALKFTHEGSITIETEKQAENDSEVTIYFAVEDTGVGIPEDKISGIFDTFTQAHSDSHMPVKGTGLGLSISQRLLKLQNSDIHVESEEGKGTRFYFSLTLPKSSDQTTDLESDNLSTQKPDNQLAGKNLLLVEDNQMNIFMAKQFLTNWEMHVEVAHDGKEAVEKARSQHFDVILMDLQLPEMDGYEAARAIREVPGYAKTPIIALTASALVEVQNKVYEAGMNDYVTKPFNPTDLYNKISEKTRS